MRRVEQVTLKQLRALDAVVRESTISAAADKLHLTGPAVHSQLKTLEKVIGSPMLQRTGSEKGEPTPQGRAMLKAYAEIRASLERAIGQIKSLDSGHRGRVVLGVVSTGKYFAPRIVALLQRQLPDVEVTLKVGNRQETIAALARGEFDLCIMGRPPREPLVNATRLAEHPHIVVAAADHPLARLDTVPRRALIREPFVMREEGSGTRILAARFLDEIGRGHEAATVVMDSNETIKQAVLNGLGLAMISAHTVAEELRSGRLVALRSEGLPIYRQWYLLSDGERPMSASAKLVHDWIVGHVDEIFSAVNLPTAA